MIPHPIDRHAENAEDRLAPVLRDKGVVAGEADGVVVRAADAEGRGIADLHRARQAKAAKAAKAVKPEKGGGSHSA